MTATPLLWREAANPLPIPSTSPAPLQRNCGMGDLPWKVLMLLCPQPCFLWSPCSRPQWLPLASHTVHASCCGMQRRWLPSINGPPCGLCLWHLRSLRSLGSTHPHPPPSTSPPPALGSPISVAVLNWCAWMQHK